MADHLPLKPHAKGLRDPLQRSYVRADMASLKSRNCGLLTPKAARKLALRQARFFAAPPHPGPRRPSGTGGGAFATHTRNVITSQEPAVTEPKPWQCPACKGWIRPDVEVHFCDGPDGGVGAKRPKPPAWPSASRAVPAPGPPTVASGGGGGGASPVTWTFPPGTTITTGRTYELGEPRPPTVTGELVHRIQRLLPSINEARRELGRDPWKLGDDYAA